MSAYIFLCDLTTEQECLDRLLFGTNPGENYQAHYRKIAVGDTLFLYNFDLGTLRGPYAATTTCQMNIEPKAWKKTKRSFPWQVRVNGAAVSQRTAGIDELRRFLPFSASLMSLVPPAELTPEQTAKVLAALGSGG